MGAIKKTVNACLISAMLAVVFSCASAVSETQGKELTVADKEKASELLKQLNDINNGSPDTINTAFTADGDTSGKKFKVEGRAVYDRKGFYYLTLTDYIFKSPMIDVYRDGDKLYFYYPAEKKLIADDVNKINFYNYTGFKAEYGFMQSLLTGGIPVINEYTISRLLKEEGDSYFLILENSEYFENINFRAGVPEKIMLMHKSSRNKAEVYLKSPVRKDKSLFFKSIKISAPELGLTMNLSFIKPELNVPVKVQNIEPLKKKKGLSIIKIN